MSLAPRPTEKEQAVDPNTGEMHKLFDRDELNDAMREQAQLYLADGTPAPDTWVVFRKGERIDVKGQPFVVEWVGKDGLLLVPEAARLRADGADDGT
jgi:hypothetical protein